MIYRWETEKERILRGIQISPEKKLEGLRLMNEFTEKFSTKRQRKLRQKLRIRS